MLDTVSDLQFVLLTIWLMAIFAVGGRYVYRVGRRRLRRWRVQGIINECRMATPHLRVVSRTTGAPTVAQQRYAPRGVAPFRLTAGYQIDPDSCYQTTGLSFPQDVA